MQKKARDNFVGFDCRLVLQAAAVSNGRRRFRNRHSVFLASFRVFSRSLMFNHRRPMKIDATLKERRYSTILHENRS